MSHNTFGHLFRVTTFGESHGPALGCVVDGCPPMIPLDGGRHPGRPRPAPAGPVAFHHAAARARRRCRSSPASLSTSDRPAGDDRHADRAPHRQRRPALEGLFRDHGHLPARATPTYTYDAKYGIRDYRGGGRSSARETAARVAAGAVARKILAGVHDPRRAGADRAARDRPRALGLGRGRPQSVLLPRRRRRPRFCADYLDGLRKAGSSIGAVIEVVAEGVPAGLGRADLRQARRRTRRRADEHQRRQGRRDRRRLRARRRCPARRTPTRCAPAMTGAPTFLSNHAGGILGGISTGQPIVARFAVKPTSSILTPRRTIDAPGRARPTSSPRAATTPASASARCRSARR